jgi:hypothetical protein
MCPLDNEFLDQIPHFLLLHNQPDYFEEGSEPLIFYIPLISLNNLRCIVLPPKIVPISKILCVSIGLSPLKF